MLTVILLRFSRPLLATSLALKGVWQNNEITLPVLPASQICGGGTTHCLRRGIMAITKKLHVAFYSRHLVPHSLVSRGLSKEKIFHVKNISLKKEDQRLLIKYICQRVIHMFAETHELASDGNNRNIANRDPCASYYNKK